MPWYSPWSDHIAKSVCKYLLQRYLGKFLEEKLTLDQLTVDLFKGIGVISDVALDVQELNKVAEEQNIPFEFTDGFIEKMSVSVPWSSILNDATNIQVEGLSLTIKKTERDKTRVSMFESMWSSMTSSMQLAEDCLKNERDNPNEEGSQAFEGVERFAHTIDSILSKIKVKFIRTVICLEEIPSSSSIGIAFEISIKLMEYFDEAAVSEAAEGIKQDFHLLAFSTKKIYLEGVTLYSDEFPVSVVTSSKISLTDESSCEQEENLISNDEKSTKVVIGRFAGKQEITIRIKQEGVDGPKIDLQFSLGPLTFFASPHQIHNLLELINGMTTSSQNSRTNVKNQCSQKPMEESDFRMIERELQMNFNNVTAFQPKGLGYQGWASTCLDGSEEEFSPLNNSCRLNDSVISSNSSLSSSVMSVSSRSSHCQGQTCILQPKRNHSGNREIDSNAVVFHFHVRLNSLNVVFLHEDILTVCVDSHQSTIAKSSFEEMRRLADEFFERLGHTVASGYGNKDVEKVRDVFLRACQLNHIRFTAAPIIVEGSETSTTHTSVIKGKCTASGMEIVECLLEKEVNSQKCNVEYVELLKFKNSSEKQDSEQGFLSRPSVVLDFRLAQTNSFFEKGKKFIHPKSDFSFEFQPFESEIDITIIDRISALLNSKPFSRSKADNITPLNSLGSDNFQKVVDNHSIPNAKKNIKLNFPLGTFKIRFPVPDLRPIHDMDKPPWWKRSVRKDVLLMDMTDVTLNTVFDNIDIVFKYEVQFRDVVVKFKDADTDIPIEFAKASAAQNSDSLLEGTHAFDWPRLIVQVYPNVGPTNLEESESQINHFKSSARNLNHQSLVTTLESSTKTENSPFSCKKIIHESDTPHGKTSHSEQDGEELIIPGDSSEIADFIDVASVNTKIKLDVTLPVASITFPSKHLYEVIYNRISLDLLLWEPSSPVFENYSTSTHFSYQHSAEDFIPSFNLCKSAVQRDSDSETESQEEVFYSVYQQKQKHKSKQLLEGSNLVGQSKVVFRVTVGQGFCDLYTPARDSQGNVIPRQHGQLHASFNEGNLFLVSGYKGKSDLDYVCVQVNRFSFYHNGLVSDAVERPILRTNGCCLPSYLELTVHKTENCALIDQSRREDASSSSNMLTASVRLQKHELTQGLKMIRVAIGIREATLRHKVCGGQSSWFAQLVDFFDVVDYPIAGYQPSTVLSEIHLHLWNCNVDYRPLYLPLRSVLTVGNFNISSNITAQTSSSTLRLIAEDAAFFISSKPDRVGSSLTDLRRDYICVMELGLFELSLRLSEKNQVNPRTDLRASANVAHLWTCSDSAKALTELLMYFASDGDLNYGDSVKEDPKQPYAKDREENEDQLLVKTEDVENSHSLSKSQVALVNDLMEEAMKESKVVESNAKKSKEGPPKTIYYERSENESLNEKVPKVTTLGSELSAEVNRFHCDDKDDTWEDEFCIVQNEAGLGMLPKKGLPEVRNLTKAPVRLVDNHFSIPLGKADLLRSPKHYPKPVLRYMLREMSLIWHMYGGSDFQNDSSTPTKNFRISQNKGSGSHFEEAPDSETVITFSKKSTSGVNFKTKNEKFLNWKHKGGPQRRHDVLMELQLNKVRFQHEVYPENTTEASRQVLLIQEVELRDRLATSTINKFLYQYSSETKPKQSQAPMVVIKSVLMRSDPKINVQECCLKVSMLPLRLNIDQDSVLFLYRFFSELSGDSKEEEDDSSPRAQTPKHQVPVMSVNVKGQSNSAQSEPLPLLIDLEEESQKKNQMNSKNKKHSYVPENKPPTQPLFFRCFIFSPEVPVKLDYQGKRVDMSHGSLAGILMGLGQLNNSELKLRKIAYRHGLLGFDKLLNFVLSEWANDIKKNQLPSLLGGVGPMHSLVQLVQGIRDLFWLPIEQYQKDGRLVRGFQRGANSFTTSTAMASLELISRLIQIIQTTAETAYDMVSPGPSVRSCIRNGRGRARQYSQPADIREGMAIAYLVVKQGIGETAETIVRVASEEHEQKGVTGAVGGVLRQIPPTVVKPIILATEATNNVIGGMKSQLVPDARKEAVEKWRGQDS